MTLTFYFPKHHSSPLFSTLVILSTSRKTDCNFLIKNDYFSMRLLCHRPRTCWSNCAMASVDAISRKFIILLFDFSVIVAMANAADEPDALLRLKISFNNAGVLQSWQPGLNPCDKKKPWEGIRCIEGSVYGIRLEGLNLSGKIDIEALSQIQVLRTVSFTSNSFSGPLPAFDKLVPLRALYLSENQFSGEIPGNFFDGMKYLKKLWLSSNRFSGPIPLSLDLIPLMELHLENNQFSGTIPPLNEESISDLDLANNNLTGPIPSGLLKFNEKAFKGNPGLCGEKAGKPCEEPPLITNENEDYVDDGSDNHTMISLYMMIVCAIILVLMIIGIVILRRRQERNQEFHMENVNVVDDESGKMMPVATDTIEVPRNSTGLSKGGGNARVGDLILVNDDKGVFGLPDLMKAAAEVLGNGPMGSSYKANISNGFTVVVKRVKEMNNVGQAAFDGEIRRLGRIKHENVLPPLAYLYRKEEKLLITEYMPKGSLLYLLHGDRGSPNIELKWPVRLKIIQGIVRGLFCIHTELSQTEVPHGNLKSSNVLLTPEFEPLLSDYGLTSLMTSTQALQALFAYKSPEALYNQRVSPTSDVYCMGIIILELLTGKFPSQYLGNGNGGTDIVQWTRSAIAEGREVELFDQDCASSTSFLPDMKRLLLIGVACTEPEPGRRLDLREAISRIEALQSGRGPDELSVIRKSVTFDIPL